MPKNKSFLVTAVFLLVVVGFTGCSSAILESLIISGPELILGQLRLTRSSGGYQPSKFASNDLLLGILSPAEITRIDYIAVPDEALFWGVDYVGFPRVEVNGRDYGRLLSILRSAEYFSLSGTGEISCWVIEFASGWVAAPCLGDRDHYARFTEVRFARGGEGEAGLIQVHFEDRLAEIRLYTADGELGISLDDPNRRTMYGLTAEGTSLVRELHKQVTIRPIPILWPEKSAAEANATAERRLGKIYNHAVGAIAGSAELAMAVGEPIEIRPADAANWYSSWMDSRSLQATFRVSGPRGEAAVITWGDECFNAEMVFAGQLSDLTGRSGCLRPPG